MASPTAHRNPDQNPSSSFEDDHLDLPLAISQPSMLSTSLEVGRSILFSRPFLLAVIFFLIYRIWFSGKTAKPNVIKMDGIPSSIPPADRVSIRKSLRAPSVTMAPKK